VSAKSGLNLVQSDFGLERMAMAEGFDSRIFLTDAEHATYLRRMPVRYLHYKRKTLCEVCGLPGTTDNPLQLAHIIGFSYGIRELKLTPDYLDKAERRLIEPSATRP